MKLGLSHYVMTACLLFAGSSVNAASEWSWVLNSSPTGTDTPSASSVMGYSAPTNTSTLVATNGSGLPDMTWYSGGYGICSPYPGDPNCSDPNHTMDNSGAYESILLGFGSSKVTLTSMTVGYISGDSDMSVLAYTGSGTPNLASATYGNLLSNGWTLVGQYANVGSNTSLNTSVSSSYWLIGAYNAVYQDAGYTQNNDFVKLYSVAGNTNNPPPPGKVSEPHTMLLMGTALLGFIGLRRRRQCTKFN